MLGPLAKISRISSRNVISSFVRNGSHGGVPGENLPFNIHDRYRLTFGFMVFAMTGISAPFLILVHQLKKQ